MPRYASAREEAHLHRKGYRVGRVAERDLERERTTIGPIRVYDECNFCEGSRIFERIFWKLRTQAVSRLKLAVNSN